MKSWQGSSYWYCYEQLQEVTSLFHLLALLSFGYLGTKINRERGSCKNRCRIYNDQEQLWKVPLDVNCSELRT